MITTPQPEGPPNEIIIDGELVEEIHGLPVRKHNRGEKMLHIKDPVKN